MDAFLATFLSVILAEMGDRPQILAVALAIRFRNDKAIIAGLALATLLNCILSAVGGSVIDRWISEATLTLFAGFAYIFAGASMLMWRRKVDPLAGWKTGAFWTAFLGLFILQFGDKSQLIIAANAARHELWGFVLAGGVRRNHGRMRSRDYSARKTCDDHTGEHYPVDWRRIAFGLGHHARIALNIYRDIQKFFID